MSQRNGKTKMRIETKALIIIGSLILIATLAKIVNAATGTGLTGKTTVTFNLTYENAIDLATIKDRLAFNTNFDWTYGTGANQANLLYHDQVALADGANTTLDLYASGSLEDSFSNALTMAAIKLLYLKNNSSDATLKLFGAAALDLLIVTGTTDEVEVPPGGIFLWICPTAAGVVTSTNKNLYLEHDGTGSSSMNVDVVAMGLD